MRGGSPGHVVLRRGRWLKKKSRKFAKSADGVLPPPHDGSGRPHCVDPMSQMRRGGCDGESIIHGHLGREYCNR